MIKPFGNLPTARVGRSCGCSSMKISDLLGVSKELASRVEEILAAPSQKNKPSALNPINRSYAYARIFPDPRTQIKAPCNLYSRYLHLKGVPIGTLRPKYILYGHMEP